MSLLDGRCKLDKWPQTVEPNGDSDRGLMTTAVHDGSRRLSDIPMHSVVNQHVHFNSPKEKEVVDVRRSICQNCAFNEGVAPFSVVCKKSRQRNLSLICGKCRLATPGRRRLDMDIGKPIDAILA